MSNLIRALSLLFGIFFFLFILVSCKKDKSVDPCGPEDLGEIHLLENARASIPFNQLMMLVYKDSLNHETDFIFRNDSLGLNTSHFSIQTQCPADPFEEKVYTGLSDNYTYYLTESGNTTGLKFIWMIAVTLAEDEGGFLISDMLGVAVGRKPSIDVYGGELWLMINQREQSDSAAMTFPQPMASINLLDKTFYNVYTNPDSSVYYNYSEGMVAFRDNDDKLWVLSETQSLVELGSE